MADDSTLKKDVNKPYRGLYTESSPSEQPDGTNTYVLNGIDETDDGNENMSSNELGNTPCGSLPTNYIPLGKVYMNDGRSVIWSVSLDEVYSEIGIVDKLCNYTTVVNNTCLGFTLNHQIQAVYRLRRGCEDVVYFTDGNKKVSYFNFAKPQDFYTTEYSAYLSNPSGEYTGDIWDCDKFGLFQSYQVPCFSELNVITGGQLPSGTFNFSIQYLDENLNATNWIYSSQLAIIYASDINQPFGNILGSSNSTVDTISGTPNTDKAIQLTLSNLDSTYPFYRIAVIQSVSGNGLISSVIASPVIPITQNVFTYDGNIDGYTAMAVTDLAVTKADIETVQHIEQLENRLILSNVAGKQVSYCDFQRYASKIASNYVVKEVLGDDATIPGNEKNANTYWQAQSYMGDEVYAFSVVYVFNDGLETPGYHIPGRSPGQYKKLDGTIGTSDDQTVLQTWNSDMIPFNDNQAAYNMLPDNQKLKKWQIYDTAVNYQGSNDTAIGAMGYWANIGAYYEPRLNCESADYWGEDACGLSLTNTPVRHHKFPSRSTEPQVRNGSTLTGTIGLYLNVSLNEGQTFPSGSVSITVNYEIDSTSASKTVTILSTDLPITGDLLDQVQGDSNDITITSITGNVTTDVDTSNNPVFTYSAYTGLANSSSFNGSLLRLLGIQFSNIEYPHPDIVGHYFVRAERDNQNRTILDKGIAGNLHHGQANGQLLTGFTVFTKDYVAPDFYNNYLFTPRFLYNKEALSGDYLRFENEFVFSNELYGSIKYDGSGSFFKTTNTAIEFRWQNYSGLSFTHSNTNYRINKNIIMGPASKDTSFIGPNSPLYNLSWSNRAQFVNISKGLPRDANTDNIPYVSVKVNRNVYPDLDYINYYRTHNCMLTLENTNIVFGGDITISKLDMANSYYRREDKGSGAAILAGILIIGAAVAVIATAGAAATILAPAISLAIATATAAGIAESIVITAVVAAAIGLTSTVIQAFMGDFLTDNLQDITGDAEFDQQSGSGGFDSLICYANEYMFGLYVESEINQGLKQDENHVCGQYFRQQTSIQDYFTNRWLYFDQTKNKWLPKGYCCPEIYHYNNDYSRQNQQSIYENLPSTYDCCEQCLELHENRNQWSEQSFQEEQADNYRVFLPNNYVDIEAEHGPISNVFKKSNNLFIQLTEALYELPQNQQERVTGELVTYIGTGDFFSILPKKISDSELGNTGSQHKWATVNTPNGVIIVNELEGEIYLLGNGLDTLSNGGEYSWFKNNLKDFFANQFLALTGTEFPNINNPANPFGVGIHSAYDQRYNRVIITKIDYLLLPQYQKSFTTVASTNGVMPDNLSSGQLAFDLTTSKFIQSNGSPSSYSIIQFTDSSHFENRSWTKSYSFKKQSWRSYHSYLPNFYLYTHTDLISFITSSSNLWKHHTPGLYHNFYGNQYPYIIEVVCKTADLTTKFWEDASLQTVARIYNTDERDYQEQRFVTFNKLTAYNSRQSTGELTLVPKDIIDEDDYMASSVNDLSGAIYITRKESDWNLNDLRDYVIDYTQIMFLKNWGAIQSQYPIDKVPNPAAISYDKDWTQLESLRDKYIILRFKFDNFTNVNLITKYITDTNNTSFR